MPKCKCGKKVDQETFDALLGCCKDCAADTFEKIDRRTRYAKGGEY